MADHRIIIVVETWRYFIILFISKHKIEISPVLREPRKLFYLRPMPKGRQIWPRVIIFQKLSCNFPGFFQDRTLFLFDFNCLISIIQYYSSPKLFVQGYESCDKSWVFFTSWIISKFSFTDFFAVCYQWLRKSWLDFFCMFFVRIEACLIIYANSYSSTTMLN